MFEDVVVANGRQNGGGGEVTLHNGHYGSNRLNYELPVLGDLGAVGGVLQSDAVLDQVPSDHYGIVGSVGALVNGVLEHAL